MGVKNGVFWYTSGVAHVRVNFPEDKVCCLNCIPFCRYEEPYRRYTCRATGEQLLHPSNRTGADCPIEFIKEDKSNEFDC